MKTLYLVRHGESIDNLEKKYAGWSDKPLTEKGIAQAQAAAIKCVQYPFEKIMSSDLKRAHQTACIIGEKMGLVVDVDQRLREIHMGDWEGLTFPHIQAKDPDLVKAWFDPSLTFTYPNGENMAGVARRAKACIFEAFETCDHLLVVSHSATIAALLSDVLFDDVRFSLRLKIRHCQVQMLTRQAETWVLEALNQ